MKIKQFKRKCIILSLVLILTGMLISIAGFGVIGFNYDDLKENVSEDAWYQTIHINNNNNLWYGVGLGDNIYLISIGNIE
jgi:hypothetical protein